MNDSYCVIAEKGSANALESHKPSGKGSGESITVSFDLKPRVVETPFTLASSMNMFLPSYGRWLRRRKNDGALNRVYKSPLNIGPACFLQ
jgi:hypothetical protein